MAIYFREPTVPRTPPFIKITKWFNSLHAQKREGFGEP